MRRFAYNRVTKSYAAWSYEILNKLIHGKQVLVEVLDKIYFGWQWYSNVLVVVNTMVTIDSKDVNSDYMEEGGGRLVL